ncbi:MAG: homocysteine S-methyltransferase family protein [Candidatus Omnitrophota bacterium]
MKKNILNSLNKKIFILDGATGTELQKYGMPNGVSPEKWCLENPSLLKKVHQNYINAGSNIIYSCTFGANRPKLSQYHIKDVQNINKKLAKIAREAAGLKVLVAGDIGPTGQFIEPYGNTSFDEAIHIFKEQVKGLLLGGVDLFVIETMLDIQEARAALIAVKELTDKFTMVTMTYETHGRTLNGNDPISSLITLQSLGANAIGCNCSTGPQDMLRFIKLMKPLATVPIAAKPNAGIPKLIQGKTTFDMCPKEFARFAKQLVHEGANMLGGCCGTTPEHIRALKDAIKNLKPLQPLKKSIGALSSARESIILDHNKEVTIVGECINPTGKKDLQKELLSGKLSLVRQLANTQKSNGARILDVNVGMPGIDEKTTLCAVIRTLAISISTPLCLDSSDIKAMEGALKIYPGRALINSISGEKNKTQALLRLAKKYGAMFILLPLAGKKLPHAFTERKKIIQAIFKKALAAGFQKEDIIVDALALTVSCNPKAPSETLKTIQWCKEQLKCKTILGLSNISFGMPQRQLINASFLQLAKTKGLSSVIADPSINNIKTNQLARNLLLNKKNASKIFLSHYSKRKIENTPEGIIKKISDEKKVFTAILEGNNEEITALVNNALDNGINALTLMQEFMIKAIIEVGQRYKNKEYFLPQLIASAETMKKAIKRIEPLLNKEDAQKNKKPLIMLATVKGDIHDIGKNIVALMLKNHGFDIMDLGKDVSSNKIIEKAKKHNPAIIGLSALMTTTMIHMQEVIHKATAEQIKSKFLIGGAVVTKHFADSLSCAYAKDSVEAVYVAKKILRP